MHAHEARLAAYMRSTKEWAGHWPEFQKQIAALPLPEAHALLTRTAEQYLPFRPLPENNRD